MFKDYFKMNAMPFSERISTNNIIRDDRMECAIAKLSYLAHDGSIGVITGQTGVGKSTLLRLFLATLPSNNYHPIYIHFTNVKSSNLLNLIAIELGANSTNSKDRRFLAITRALKNIPCTPILILDEAHLLSTEAIIDLRLLISSALDNGEKSLKIILCGQEDLNQTIKRASCLDFANRISVSNTIKPLSCLQTQTYIVKQLQAVNGDTALFDSEVIEEIYTFSNGIPRRINQICTLCLLCAKEEHSQKITTEILARAISDLRF